MTLVSLTLICLVAASPGQNVSRPAEKTRTKQGDSGIELRQFNAGSIERLLADPTFDYNRSQKPLMTFLDRLRFWLSRLFHYLPARGISFLNRILPYLFVGAAMVFVISRLLKTDIKGILFKSSAPARIEFEEISENLETMDFQALTGEAVRQGKFRRAVRLSYLHLLKRLADQHRISWRTGKTNSAYLRELNDDALKAPFAKTTQLFEYIWYGDGTVDKEAFKSVISEFESFDKLLNRETQ